MKYEAPEIFELGDAEELTQFGCSGLAVDADAFPRRFTGCPPSPPPPGGSED